MAVWPEGYCGVIAPKPLRIIGEQNKESGGIIRGNGYDPAGKRVIAMFPE